MPSTRRRLAALLTLAAVSCAGRALAQVANERAPRASLDQLSRNFADLATRVAPSVVQVLATGYGSAESPGAGLLAKQRATGSGVILTADGYIVTNAHVVEGAQRVRVLLRDSSSASGASILRPRGETIGAVVVGIDAETDLAVLKVQREGLAALALGDSEALRQGEIVMAFGSPLGLENSVSLGVVSTVARQLQSDSPMIYVQTDASINPGNSGGPLVDAQGRVVGINTLILSQSGGNEGIGFAAPANIVRNVFEQIRKTGRVRRGEIGATVQTLTPTLAAGLGLARSQGALVSDVAPDGSAAKAGLATGDVIVAIDGKPMENGRQLSVNLYRRGPGDSATLDVLRGSQRLSLVVTVSERARDPEALRRSVSPETNLVARLGLLGLDLDETSAALLPPLRAKSGVVVAFATADGPAWAQAPEPGDVIYAVNQKLVSHVEELREALAKLKPGTPVVLLVERRGVLTYLSAELE
jgi:serine protease Do